MAKRSLPIKAIVLGASILASVGQQALAADATAGLAMLKHTAMSMVSGYCSKPSQEVKVADGSIEPRGTNQQLHRCEYAREMAAYYTSIKEPARFVRYEEWAKTAADIDPSLTRQAFMAALQARKDRLAAESAPATNN